MNTRPKPGETEDDILKLQEEFFKNKFKPSATLVNCQKNKSTKPIENESQVKIQSEIFLLGDIVEKNTLISEPVQENKIKFSGGFPQAKRRQNISNNTKGSLFSQQNKKLKQNELQTEYEDFKHENSILNISKINQNIPSCSYLVKGEISEEIHKENVEKLNQMSEEEILDEQRKLLQSLDPEVVKFLKSKRQQTTQSENQKMEVSEPILEERRKEVEDIESANEMIEHSTTENWMNFNQIETEKFQWMQNIEIPKKLADNQPYEARFDFSGWLLPYVDSEISEKNRVLYHHGEEPGRPGYTLKELFTLSRSNVQQQRILSLNTISNILSLNSTGVYKNIIELPIEQIFFIIRVSLDDNTPAILNASIKAMHHLFYYQIDEICLDSLLGFGSNHTQPMLTIENNDNAQNTGDENEINDQQLAEMDLVKCLARTDILIRIRYIINIVKPTTETIIYCLELLIRLMRDSQSITLQVLDCEDLFASIIKYFVPKIYKLDVTKDYCYGIPLVAAVKLLRITACRSKIYAQKLINRYNIMESICSYISNDIGENIIGVKIQIESYYFLAVALHYNLAINNFQDVQQYLIRSLDYHFRNTSIDDKSTYTKQTHFSALMSIVSEAALINCNLISNFVPLLMQCVAKYCSQVSNLSKFECGKLQIISSLLVTVSNVIKSSPIQKDDCVEKYVDLLLNSSGFEMITSDIRLSSNLLCDYEPNKSSANFSSVEAAVWPTSDHVIPCLLTKSCIPFLAACSYYIETSSNQLKLKFLLHPNILKYLTQLKSRSTFYLTSNWFTRLECQLLMNILKSVVMLQNLSQQMLFYELAVKCLNIFTIEQKIDIDFILVNIVFNKQFYPNEMLIDNLRLEESENVIANSLQSLGEIYGCYSEVMGLKVNSYVSMTSLTLDIRIGNIIPVDWVFLPLIALYATHSEQTLTDENKQNKIIIRCLQWIFMFETYFPELASQISPTDRFCRLSCVFLCSNSAFLESDIKKLLELCVKVLLKPNNFKDINFDKEIQGLNNFQDFYAQLLEQYQGVSYGDKLFANFILVPLAQRHNIKWRKMLWSEYIGVAQTLFINENESLLDRQEFLNPPESDISLLKCYRRALISNYLNRSPLLKEVANFHVENYVKNK